MPTTDVTNTLVANISSIEQSTSNVPINRSTGNPAYASNLGLFTTYQALAAGVNNIPLPISPCTQIYIRNIDTTKNIVVNWTPLSTTVAVNVIRLAANGGQIILWLDPAGAEGITALSLTPSAAGCLVEYFLGG